MSYQLIKNGIIGIMQGLGYSESNEAWNMENASANEYGNTFILKALGGEISDESEQLADRFYDVQTWEMTIAFEQSSQNESINMDSAQASKDIILSKIDDPASWIGFARMLKYKSWKMEETVAYFLLTVTITVTDVYTY
jgi:hypothetical protein